MDNHGFFLGLPISYQLVNLELIKKHGCTTTYERVRRLVVNGTVPAIKDGGKWQLSTFSIALLVELLAPKEAAQTLANPKA